MASTTQAMIRAGQSPWLDFISRPLLDTGELARMVADEEVTGLTSNPSIFEKAFASGDYAAEIQQAARSGITDPYEAFVCVAVNDIQRACDELNEVYQRTDGADGFVSFEIPPGVERDLDKTVAEAQRLAGLVARPNLMIKVPGTPEGVRALEELVFAGINVNQTLLFSCAVYEASAQAYLAGLERRVAARLPVDRAASVASFFVSRLDTAVDALLPEGSPLRGKAAIANAQDAYGRFRTIFSGPRWEALTNLGARVQRPLWASTSTKNPAYSDVLYVEGLVARDTVNTLPEPTLRAVLDHATIKPAITENTITTSRDTLAGLGTAGIDLQAVTDRLLVDGLAAFENDFRRLLERAGEELAAAAAVGA